MTILRFAALLALGPLVALSAWAQADRMAPGRRTKLC